MTKVINGKKYSTETAKCIGYWENGLGTHDFNFRGGALYQKKTGEFFIFEDGGEFYPDHIIPASIEEAKEYAENYLDYDEYVEAFGEPEE